MAIHLMALAWEVGGLSAAEKLLLLKLADDAAHDGSVAAGRFGRAAEQCGMTRAQAQRVLAWLAARGFITHDHGSIAVTLAPREVPCGVG